MKYSKPESFTDADWTMVMGYMRGRDDLPPESDRVAYMHGYRNGQDDLCGQPRESADVLRRRAEMIPGISKLGEIKARGDE